MNKIYFLNFKAISHTTLLLLVGSQISFACTSKRPEKPGVETIAVKKPEKIDGITPEEHMQQSLDSFHAALQQWPATKTVENVKAAVIKDLTQDQKKEFTSLFENMEKNNKKKIESIEHETEAFEKKFEFKPMDLFDKPALGTKLSDAQWGKASGIISKQILLMLLEIPPILNQQAARVNNAEFKKMVDVGVKIINAFAAYLQYVLIVAQKDQQVLFTFKNEWTKLKSVMELVIEYQE